MSESKNRKFLKPLTVALAATLTAAASQTIQTAEVKAAIIIAEQASSKSAVQDAKGQEQLTIGPSIQLIDNKLTYHSSHSSHSSHASHYSSRW